MTPPSPHCQTYPAFILYPPPPPPRDALEGDGPPEAVRQAIGGGCQSGWGRLQMPLRLALGVTGTVAGHRLGALDGGGGLWTCVGGAAPPPHEGCGRGGGGPPVRDMSWGGPRSMWAPMAQPTPLRTRSAAAAVGHPLFQRHSDGRDGGH